MKSLHKKLSASKVARVPIFEISRLLTWESQEKWHLDVALVVNHKEYYKGEGGGFPQVWAMMNFVGSCMLVVWLCIKSVSIMH
jgi:hypothetical protein